MALTELFGPHSLCRCVAVYVVLTDWCWSHTQPRLSAISKEGLDSLIEEAGAVPASPLWLMVISNNEEHIGVLHAVPLIHAGPVRCELAVFDSSTCWLISMCTS